MSINIQATFKVEAKEVKDSLVELSRLTGRFSKNIFLEIRVLSNCVDLCVNGTTKRVGARTEGEADICLPLSLFKTFLSANNSGFVKFLFRPGQISCGSSIYSSSVIEVLPVFSNTENVLPTNLNNIEVLRYWINKSSKEIEAADLTAKMGLAKRKINTNILEALEYLKQYEIEYDDLEELLMKKIRNDNTENINPAGN